MAGLKDTPTVYNIPAGHSFADALVQGLLQRVGDNRLELSKYTLLLPSRRACRVLRDAFLRHSGGNAMLLPNMHPLGDVDAEDIALLLAGEDNVEEFLNLPPAISKLERQLLLARIIQSKDPEKNFDQAVALASELGAFLDEVQTERLSFDDLVSVVPEEFAGHWQETLEFLKILTAFWPEILSEQGKKDIAERRNLLVEAQIKAWKVNPPEKYIIAAGSTGPVPAVAELLALVAHLPNGEVVLPGLDAQLDDKSWKRLEEDHPQYSLKKLLQQMRIGRSEVATWNVSGKVNTARVRLLSETMRPAETTDKWRKLTLEDVSEKALSGLTVVECATAQEEADVIAFAMREAVEQKEKTCALITPDRRLARRVAQSLKRWGVVVDDSGGQPLTDFPVGSYLMLIAEMAEDNLSPVSLLSFLKHPLLAAHIEPTQLRDRVQFLDEYVLRGPRHSGGFEGLKEAAQNKTNEDVLQWLEEIEQELGSFVSTMSSASEENFRAILLNHIQTAEALAATVEKSGDKRLWQGEAGEAAAAFVSELLSVAESIPALSPEHYTSIFGMLLKSNTVRPRFGTHPRLSILGQIEARLYCADMVILAGLNEGSWPKLPKDDPWMSRPMRKQFGLPAPEKDISLAAHDFVQAASAREVLMTRAKKVDGTPTTPARWLLRMETVLEAVGLELKQVDGSRYRDFVKVMDTPEDITPVSRPAPCPPVEVRPRKMSVTNIESWMRDPYQVYAKYILNLRALDDLDADAGGAERGTFIHTALEKFIQTYQDDLPENAVEQLLAYGQEALEDMRIQKEVQAFWWPRFERVAEQFVAQERDWRKEAKPFATEISGEVNLPAEKGGFTITAKADRIDSLGSSSYAIIDYKSGYAPGNTEVKAGLSPQLPLEAVILQEGGFPNVQGTTGALMYWKVTGSGQKPVERQLVNPRGYSVEQIIEDAKDGMVKLVDCFDNPKTPYLSYPRMDARPRFSDYEHLSRIKEWGVLGDDEGEAA